jgi:hypothetical protein
MTKDNLIYKFPELLHEDTEYIDGLVEYYTSLEYLSEENGKNLEFNNKDKRHAVGVMSTIFKIAKENIKIFAGDFGGDICDKDDYMNELEMAINRNIPVSIVFENNPYLKSKCLNKLIELKGEGKNILLYKLNEDFKKNLISKGVHISHFLISDSQKFRYEEDGINYKAFCNFDDKKLGKILDRNHELFILNSTVIN